VGQLLLHPINHHHHHHHNAPAQNNRQATGAALTLDCDKTGVNSATNVLDAAPCLRPHFKITIPAGTLQTLIPQNHTLCQYMASHWRPPSTDAART
jgi:hypothetical protein